MTDARGVARLASLLYAGAGWAHINFIVPAGPGPAEIAIVCTDGTQAVARTILGQAAPGLGSASLDGRGVAKAWTDADARVVQYGPMADAPGKDWVVLEIPAMPPGDTEVLMWADGVLSNVLRVRIGTLAPGVPDSRHGPSAGRTARYLDRPQ